MLDTKGYKYTHSGCVILIVFPQQHLLHEGASMLRYTYTDRLVLVLRVIYRVMHTLDQDCLL